MMAELLKKYFYLSQVGIGLVFVIIAAMILRSRSSGSGFRVREADRPRGPSTGDDLANARMRRSEPLRLDGIRLDGRPHEILGVPENSGKSEIQKAYRDLMKRYHPDKIGRPGSREWTD